MAERLPTPVMQVGFEETAPVPDCLRSALATAKRLGMGVLFVRNEQEYVVWPWHDVPQVLELWDTAMALSVQAHEAAHTATGGPAEAPAGGEGTHG